MKYLILLFSLLPFYISADCQLREDRYVSANEEDLDRADELYTPIEGKHPSFNSFFDEETFYYVGKTNKGIEVAFIFTTWSNQCIPTSSILFFNNGKLTNMYSGAGFYGHAEISGNIVNIFSENSIIGSIDSTKPLPKKLKFKYIQLERSDFGS